MVKISDITSVLEAFAPLSLQESYDNSGLLVGNVEGNVGSALLCVDITEAVLDEAVAVGAGLIVSHHPIIFHPLRRLTGSTLSQRVVEQAIRANIALYACHTNLDVASEGVSGKLAEIIGLEQIQPLTRGNAGGAGLGVVGVLSEPMATGEFLRDVCRKLSVKVVRHNKLCRTAIGRVAVCGGSGSSLIEDAKVAGADIFISSDMKYNHFADNADEIIIADIGHFESEYCVIDLLYTIITKKIPNFALHKSRESVNPVSYFVTI